MQKQNQAEADAATLDRIERQLEDRRDATDIEQAEEMAFKRRLH